MEPVAAEAPKLAPESGATSMNPSGPMYMNGARGRDVGLTCGTIACGATACGATAWGVTVCGGAWAEAGAGAGRSGWMIVTFWLMVHEVTCRQSPFWTGFVPPALPLLVCW
jgi:hypothetical protein